MATTSEARALPFFTDLLGQPLSSGYIYIGQPGLDPIAYPAVIHSDLAGSVVVAQPVRTTNGHAAAAGALIHLFVPIPYSITILDSAGRLVYASLQETDPIAATVGTSSVQSAPDLATLRARSGGTTNQVWVTDFGMYVYQPTDTTSPESIPNVIVGNDGSRYYLDSQFVQANWMHVSGASQDIRTQGLWATWNDDNTGSTFLTNNRGGGAGGFVIRNVDVGNTVELGRVTIGPTGAITSTAGITTSSGDIRSAGNLIATTGTLALNGVGDRNLRFDGTNYVMPSANLFVNGSQAMTNANNLTNLEAGGIGSYTIGTATMPTPGTWQLIATISSVYLWLRTA